MVFAKGVTLKTLNVEVPSDYGVLKTEIHFDERDLEPALKVKKIITEDLIKVINYFQYVPENVVHFNVDPYTRLTNGNARTFPTNIINLYNFPPNSDDHLIIMEDWLRGLVFHEYTHITHLEQRRGYLKFFKYVFGSITTLPPGIVPRWFTEGIAVWSESHLINGGRLNNPLFRKELLIQFMREDQCKTIDCLDEPGVYPGGQLSYWAGAHFMEFLENKQAGTIKCMVEKNSQNIVFNLNYAFKMCADGSVQDLFAEFRENLIKTGSASENAAYGTKISNAFGSDDLQKGIALDGNILFKVEKNRKREALVSYDLQDNVNMMISQYKFPIADIAGVTTVPNMDAEQTDQGKFLIVGFNEDLRFRSDNHTWKLINTETLLLENTLPFIHDPSYVIGLGNNRYLTASFIDNKWMIERQKVDLAQGKLIESDVVHHFGNDVNVTYFKKHGQKILIKLNRGVLGTALYASDLTLEKFYKIYESKEYFDLPMIHESFVVVREKGKQKVIDLDEGFKKFTTTDLDKNALNNVTYAEVNDSRILVLENGFKTKELSLKDSMGLLKKNKSGVTANFSPANFQDTASTNTVANTNAESFPQFHHMLPHYWFFATGTGENIDSYGAQTSFSDPMDMNGVSVAGIIYDTKVNGVKFGGNVDFYHRFSSVSDLWTLTGFFNHEYSKTDFSNYINRTTEMNIGSSYALLMKRWTLIPGIYIGKTDTKDFISDRTVTNKGLRSTLAYTAYSFDDFFQSLVFQLKFQSDKPNTGDAFLNTQMILSSEARLHERLIAGVKSSFGFLDKKGFRDGVLYAGGTNGLENRWHEFYGLPYSNAYGNNIFTFRTYLDWNFWYIYRGYSIVPLYLKEAHLLGGYELLKADRIILDGRSYKDETIHSIFIGPKIKTNVAYFIPIDFDVIFSSIKKPNGAGSVNQVELDISAEF
jgi:hypothetical protein